MHQHPTIHESVYEQNTELQPRPHIWWAGNLHIWWQPPHLVAWTQMLSLTQRVAAIARLVGMRSRAAHSVAATPKAANDQPRELDRPDSDATGAGDPADPGVSCAWAGHGIPRIAHVLRTNVASGRGLRLGLERYSRMCGNPLMRAWCFSTRGASSPARQRMAAGISAGKRVRRLRW